MVDLQSILARRAKISIIGLGYVGLPLAVAFSRKAEVIGFDVSARKIEELRRGVDSTGEMGRAELSTAAISYSTDPAQLREALFHIVTVPTPIDRHKRPDLSCLLAASRTIGEHLRPGSIVVYESTVYPGVTEDICVPILEERSGLRCGRDFKVGYSPERINPGDKVHTLERVVKVVSGQDAETLDLVAQVYELIVTAGVFRASSIRVAEAAKVIENTQRDLNIALMNELAIIFNRMGISTRDVLAAACSKWNFLPFTPGLVGGHCIGVDPFYLTFKAEEIGYRPQVILAGRRINDGMGKYVAEMTVKKMIQAGKAVKQARVLILGLTFKENVSDIRNSRVIDIIKELAEYEVETLVHDPLASPQEVRAEYGLDLVDLADIGVVDAIILAVAHQPYRELTPARLRELCANGNGKGVLIDVKGMLEQGAAEAAGLIYWGL